MAVNDCMEIAIPKLLIAPALNGATGKQSGKVDQWCQVDILSLKCPVTMLECSSISWFSNSSAGLIGMAASAPRLTGLVDLHLDEFFHASVIHLYIYDLIAKSSSSWYFHCRIHIAMVNNMSASGNVSACLILLEHSLYEDKVLSSYCRWCEWCLPIMCPY